MDTSSAEQDDVDIGRDGADRIGGTEPRPRGFPSLPEAADHKAKVEKKGCPERQPLRLLLFLEDDHILERSVYEAVHILVVVVSHRDRIH